MADLVFSKRGNSYVAQTTVNNDYNLHLERESDGPLYMNQKNGGATNYAACMLPELYNKHAGKAVDIDISHGVYPKDIEIISPVKVTSGKVTEKSV